MLSERKTIEGGSALQFRSDKDTQREVCKYLGAPKRVAGTDRRYKGRTGAPRREKTKTSLLRFGRYIDADLRGRGAGTSTGDGTSLQEQDTTLLKAATSFRGSV